MKKGFGILFVVLGIVNFISRMNDSSDEKMFQKFSFGIGLLGLGIWMIKPVKKDSSCAASENTLKAKDD